MRCVQCGSDMLKFFRGVIDGERKEMLVCVCCDMRILRRETAVERFMNLDYNGNVNDGHLLVGHREKVL